ncbi:vacuolar protein-sorting-associated protein 25 isoform X2 [Apodemus sylvaticus]|uniref:vacuolar protein-sorting-associated protein 25 isoform X2 n=1 Tax=Apodemus sylvaticus TaxID=10129 RepID=UPI0022418D91|nr:vacuolar protein-sorting-associated protein 25 isoform X2 [Apodemus sylvaticus]
MAMSFEWPWQYRFPPFFTLQPNVDTRQKQLAAWCSLVLSFCRLHKQSSMTVMEAQESPLFNNVKLQRKLPVESIQIVLEELRKKGNLEWLDKSKSSFLILWRRPEEWGKLIYQWVSRSGQNNSVFTLYELTSGEDTEDEGMPRKCEVQLQLCRQHTNGGSWLWKVSGSSSTTLRTEYP